MSCGDRVAGSGLYTHQATGVLHLVCLEARIRPGAPWVGICRMPSLVVVESRRTSARRQTQPHMGPTLRDTPGHLSVTPAWGNRASFCQFPAYIIPLSPHGSPTPPHIPRLPPAPLQSGPSQHTRRTSRQRWVCAKSCHLATVTHLCVHTISGKTCRNPPPASAYGIAIPRLICTRNEAPWI